MDEGTQTGEISSLRRGLQRHYVNILASLVLRNASQSGTATSLLDFVAMETTWGAPEDARVLARYQLRRIRDQVSKTINQDGDRIELMTLAHLEDVRDRITKVLEAPLEAL